jgi:DNA-binding SARP family transcriptional activator
VNASETPVFFGVLGPLLVTGDRDGAPIRIPQAKQRIIMAALLLKANRTVLRPQLTEALWEGTPPPNAMAATRTYVARLRQALGDLGSRLVTRPAGYMIEIHQLTESDLGRLEQARRELREAADAAQWEQVSLVSVRALNLWRGAPLEDIPSASLCGSAIAGLNELRIHFILTRIDAEISLGRERDMLSDLRVLASDHPLHEHIQAQLMLAYYRCGQQAEALQVYQDVRASLIEKLGAEPGPELRLLQNLVLTSDPVLDSPVALSRMQLGRDHTESIQK